MQGRGTAAVLLVALTTGSAAAADVTVRVVGVVGTPGTVLVALCKRDEFLRSRCARSATAQTSAGTATATLRNVTPGLYAVQAHHDRDGDGVVARNALGIPTEGVGFSRNPTMRFGPPIFEDVAVEVGDQPVGIDVSLRFEPGA